MAYDIFISYRRSDASKYSKELYKNLTESGYSVSFDVENLGGRQAFPEKLKERIDECKDFIFIISEDTFNWREEEWVREELAHALTTGKKIIPILINNCNIEDLQRFNEYEDISGICRWTSCPSQEIKK